MSAVRSHARRRCVVVSIGIAVGVVACGKILGDDFDGYTQANPQTPPASSCKGVPAGGACSVSPECGCESSLRCVVVDQATGKTACKPGGQIPVGSRCSTDEECVAGAGCSRRACARYCDPAKPACPSPSARCEQQVTEKDAIVPGAFVCSHVCFPPDPSRDDAVYDPCGQSVNCIPTETGASHCDGRTSDVFTPAFSPCDDSGKAAQSRCQRGQGCFRGFFAPANQPYTCKVWCIDNTVCPKGLISCQSLTPRLFAGPRTDEFEIGICDAIAPPPGYECKACNSTADCAADATCLVRNCDGVKGCFNNTQLQCPSIGGKTCPTPDGGT